MKGCTYRDRRSGRLVWAVRYRDVDGRIRRERTAAQTRGAALELLEARVRSVEKARAAGLPRVRDLLRPRLAPTFQEYSETFEKAAAAHHTTETLRGYKSVLKLLREKLGPRRLDEIREADLQEYADELRKTSTASTVRNRINCLSAVFREAIRAGKVQRNPARAVRVSGGNLGLPRYLSEEEEAALLAAAGPELRDQVEVSIYSGMRAGEQTRLTWGDVREDELVIRNTKSKRDRIVPLCDKLRAALGRIPRRVDAEGRALPEVFGRRANRDEWTAALGAAGISAFRWHDLRHTFCSRMAQRGVPIQAIGALAGHSSHSVTLRYAHLAPGNLRTAVRALDAKTGPESTQRVLKA